MILNEEDSIFTCTSCDGQAFISVTSLLQHCRSKRHTDEWCERCQWLFVSSEARTDHVRKSDKHHQCEVCDEEFENQNNLTMVSR